MVRMTMARFSRTTAALLILCAGSWIAAPSGADAGSCCPGGCGAGEGTVMACMPAPEDGCGHDAGLVFSPPSCSGGAEVARVVAGKMALSPILRFETTLVAASLETAAAPPLPAVPARIPDPPPRG
jgi:hypothetical protein